MISANRACHGHRHIKTPHADQELLVPFTPVDPAVPLLTADSTREEQLDPPVSSTSFASDMLSRRESDEKESDIKGDFGVQRDFSRSISVRIVDVWESQAKLEENGELHGDEWQLYYQAARWPQRVHILSKWRETVVSEVGVPRQERFIKWVSRQSIWIVSFFLCCILYLC